jgi:RNA polymerase sigma factor (sigma-70 family)
MDVKERVELASEIIRRYDSSIRALIRSYVRNDHDADDIYQNVFLSLIRVPPTSFTFLTAYLRQIVRNHAADLARRAESRARFASDYVSGHREEPVSADPANILIEAEQMRVVKEFFESVLPSHQAKVLMERCGRGNNTQETAQRLGLKRRTVSRYYCMAVKRVRQIARDEGVQGDPSALHLLVRGR